MYIRKKHSRRIGGARFYSKNQSKNPKEDLFQKLLRFSEIIIGVGVLLYLMGFIIENVYLGSFGIAVFDIIKVRYILIGCLFSIFCIAVAVPSYDLIIYFRNEKDFVFLKAIKRLLINSFFIFFGLLLGGRILSILSGPTNAFPIDIGNINPQLSIGFWIDNYFPKYFINSLRAVGYFCSIILLLILIILILYIIINPKKDGKRIKRKEQLKNIFDEILKTGFSSIIDLICLMILILVIGPIFASLVIFLTSNEVSSGSIQFFIDFDYTSIYFRFALAVIGCFIGISTTLLSIVYAGKTTSSEPKEKSLNKPKELLKKMVGWVYISTIFITFLIPVYSYGIYPLIPQQIGGGKPVPVMVFTNDPEIQISLQSPECDSYIIDRTSSSVLLLCINSNKTDFKVFEVQMSKIDTILFTSEK